MRSRVLSLLNIIGVSILLCSCGTEEKGNDKIMQYFEKDLYTQKVDTQRPVKEDTVTDKKDNDHYDGYDSTLSEITLVGEDKSVPYEIIDGTDVKYKGILFKNLYTNVHALNTTYDKNTLINFIIKTYEAKSSTIYTVMYTDEKEAEDSDIEAITFDEMLNGCTKYETVKHKYGESVFWMLQLIDSETRREVQMYGATSYILVTADGVSREIDMTQYDSGVNKNLSENSVDIPTDGLEAADGLDAEAENETHSDLDESEETISSKETE